MKFICALVLVLCFATPAFPQSIDWVKVHDLTIQGIDQLYNLEMEKSEQTFDQVITMAPGDPRGYFFKGMNYFWTYTLNKDEKAFNRFFDLSENVIDICERQLDKDGSNATATFYLGGIYGYRGLAYHRSGSMMKAAGDGRKGYFYLKDAARLKPDLYDAQMGFGLFSYLIGKLPKSSRWLLNVLGFEGNIEGGLAALKVAAQKGTYTHTEATFYLSQFLNVENRPDEAREYLKQLIDKYPDNTLFLVTFAQWELRQDRVEEAIAAAQKAISINNQKKVRIGDEFAHGVLANCYFVKNDFTNAVAQAESYLQKVVDKDIITNALFYRLGVSYEILGNREKALTAYKRIKKVNSDNAWNYQFYRRGLERMQRPLSEID
ncbi:MAG: tetratricopeptide repeat protein, partial [bacterium]